eukprot:2268443-Prymnesium_polylepis.2
MLRPAVGRPKVNIAQMWPEHGAPRPRRHAHVDARKVKGAAVGHARQEDIERPDARAARRVRRDVRPVRVVMEPERLAWQIAKEAKRLAVSGRHQQHFEHALLEPPHRLVLPTRAAGDGHARHGGAVARGLEAARTAGSAKADALCKEGKLCCLLFRRKGVEHDNVRVSREHHGAEMGERRRAVECPGDGPGACAVLHRLARIHDSIIDPRPA